MGEEWGVLETWEDIFRSSLVGNVASTGSPSVELCGEGRPSRALRLLLGTRVCLCSWTEAKEALTSPAKPEKMPLRLLDEEHRKVAARGVVTGEQIEAPL